MLWSSCETWGSTSASTECSIEAVAARLAKDGISYTEFSYQLLQSYDYLQLFRHECVLNGGIRPAGEHYGRRRSARRMDERTSTR